MLEDSEEIICYTRTDANQTLLVIANYSKTQTNFTAPSEILGKKWQRILTNYNDNLPVLDGDRILLPYEVEVYKLVK
jgi:glycosidase